MSTKRFARLDNFIGEDGRKEYERIQERFDTSRERLKKIIDDLYWENPEDTALGEALSSIEERIEYAQSDLMDLLEK